MANSVLAVTDADGRPIIGQGFDPVTHQFAAQLAGPALTDATTGIVYQSFAEAPIDGFKASYSVCKQGLVVAASATDIFTLTGSATRTVRITHVEVSGIATTILDTSVQVFVRTTADSGGTSTSITPIPHDQNNAAATATAAAYTANPTINDGTARLIRVEKVLFNLSAPSAGSESGRLMLDFGTRPSQAIVLRGVAQQLAINLNGVTVAGPSVDISIEFTEDNWS